ncbi:MAG TPA: ribbon-helix-helix domain-containing protein [Methanocella sp.]|nr:ribbon-helix-helix domain-containing protein [Methanocella sp.]
MPKICVDIPRELMDDLMAHVGDDKKYVNQSDAVRAAIRRLLDALDEIDVRRGRTEAHAGIDERRGPRSRAKKVRR